MSKTNYKKVLATAALASTAAMASSIGTFANAQSPATEQNAAQNLAACIQGSKSADILLVIDETGSLVGKGTDGTATDPDGKRVAAAKNFAREMARYADDNKAAINVKLAGFDQEYRAHGGWQKLAVAGEGTNIDADIEAFKDRTDGEYTDYANGLKGAAEAIGDGSSQCKAVLFFSDGFPTREQGGADAVMQDVCQADGPVGRLRAANTLVFTVGLAPARDTQDTPELRRISEGQCSDSSPNGQHLFANEPSKLLAAFRQMVPNGGSYEADKGINEEQEFILDNSITSVRVSAQPDSEVVEASQLVPVLTGPDGVKVELTHGTQTVAGHEVNVVPNTNVPGGYDVDIAKGAGEWAGRWAFGYKPQDQAEGQYHVKMTIEPGLAIVVDNSDNSKALSLKSDKPIPVSLLNKEGEQHNLDGTADLKAEVVRDDGSTLDLGNHDIRSGHVEIPLNDVAEAARGTLRLSASITTLGVAETPGTALAPIVFEKQISIVPVNAPNIPASATLNMNGTKGSFEIPVTGPGEVWVDEGTIDANGTQIKYSSDHNASNPLKLGRDEAGTILVNAEVEEPVDAAITGAPVAVSFKDADGNDGAPVNVAVNGSVNAPVDKVVFGATLIGVLLLGILIPVGLLYLIRFLTGKIPSKPGIHVLRIPVTTQNLQLLRQDTGREFDVDYQKDFINAPREKSTGKSLNAAGMQIKVRTGFNPLAPAQAVVDAVATMSDDGKQVGGRAVLPLAVHNHWFALVDQNNPADQAIVLLCDESISPEHLENIVREVREKGASRIDKLSQQVAEAPVNSANSGGPATAAGFAATEPAGGGWGQSSSNGADESPAQGSGWGASADSDFATGGFSSEGFGSGGFNNAASGFDNSDSTSTAAWGAVEDTGNTNSSSGWGQPSDGGWPNTGWGTDQPDSNGGFNR